MDDRPLSSEEFTRLLPEGSQGPSAIAISGGPDSMALAWLLAYSGAGDFHALTVDHGMRPDSVAEAEAVGGWLRHFPGVQHQILRLTTRPRGMAEARRLRYAAMADYCRDRGLNFLFLAHHQDDQAETLLFRLAKGSGLDGLGAMRPWQKYDDRLTLLRPLLDVPKTRLIATCAAACLPFVRDPTNENPAYARSRLRAAKKALAEEGLTPKRLATTAMRLRRAGTALDHYADLLYVASLRRPQKEEGDEGVAFDLATLAAAPAETRLRVLLRATRDNSPLRREKIEALAAELFAVAPFRRRTLGGYIFTRDDRAGLLVIALEKAGLPSSPRSSIL